MRELQKWSAMHSPYCTGLPYLLLLAGLRRTEGQLMGGIIPLATLVVH
jgi:hypothetical protein